MSPTSPSPPQKHKLFSCRAHAHGFELVLVHLQQQPPLGREQLGPLERQLQRQLSLHLLQQQQCPPGAVRVVTGWQQQGCSSIGAEAAAASAAVAAAGEGAMGCSPPPAEGHVLTAVLLSAADAQWPLLAASTAAVAGGLPASADLDRGGGDGVIDSAAADLDAAIAAPARLRERLRAVAGPLAARDPDFVLVSAVERDAEAWAIELWCLSKSCLPVVPGHHEHWCCFLAIQVTGPALTLAGFPAWCVRVSEVYGGGGPLARLTAARLDAVLRRFSRTQQRFGK